MSATPPFESQPNPSPPPRPSGAPLRPEPVRSSADALRVVLLAVRTPLIDETIAFLLDEHGVGGVITAVSGTDEPDSVLPIAECLALAGSQLPSQMSLVLATVRPQHALLPGDIDRWRALIALTAHHGVRLLEWFVVAPGGVHLPRELAGGPDPWLHASDRPS